MHYTCHENMMSYRMCILHIYNFDLIWSHRALQSKRKYFKNTEKIISQIKKKKTKYSRCSFCSSSSNPRMNETRTKCFLKDNWANPNWVSVEKLPENPTSYLFFSNNIFFFFQLFFSNDEFCVVDECLS